MSNFMSMWGSRNYAEILVLRRIRDEVRQLTSILTPGVNVKERISTNWACDMENHVIFWRPTNPHPPFDVMSDDEILFNIGHEAGHLLHSSMMEPRDDWDKAKNAAFKRWWNWIEDIRIERFMGRMYPGFERLRIPDNTAAIEANRKHANIEEWRPIDQVGSEFMCIEVGAKPLATPALAQKAKDNWDIIDKACWAESSAELVAAITPLFEELYEPEPESPDAGGGKGEEEGGAKGNGPMSFQEMLEAIADSLEEGEAKDRVQDLIQQVKESAEEANEHALQLGGTAPGVSNIEATTPDDSWMQVARAIEQDINSLARRFRSVLRNNAMDNYSDGHRRGRLNPRRARKAVAGNNRIFRKKGTLGDRDYTLGLAIDVSGSMGTGCLNGKSRAENALHATVLLAEACQRAGVRSFIIPWGSLLFTVKHVEKNLTDEYRRQTGADIHNSPSGTYEAPALLESIEQFRRVPESHGMLIVVSDGHTIGVDESTTLLDELMGMGIHTINVSIGAAPGAHYVNTLQVDDGSQLVDVMPRLFNDSLRKGGSIV